MNEDYKKAVELWNDALESDPDMHRAREKIKETEALLQLKDIEKSTPDKFIKEYNEELKMKEQEDAFDEEEGSENN